MFFGTTSHLEHVAMFTLTLLAQTDSQVKSNYMLAGSVLCNATRIVNGAISLMWLPVFEDNQPAILASGSRMRRYIVDLQRLLESNGRQELLNVLQEAHTYRCSMARKDVRRESVYAEHADIIKANLSPSLLVSTLGMPTVLAAAITLNIRETDEHFVHGLSIADHINPSALDGTAAMIATPAFLADILLENRASLTIAINDYLDVFDDMLNAIAKNDKSYLTEAITTANALRAQMPPPRRGDAVRQEFAMDVPSVSTLEMR